MVRTWFGPLPCWEPHFRAHVERLKPFGWDFLIINDFDWYRQRVRETLGVEPTPNAPRTRKCGDWDPMIGRVFAKELAGYDFWGHVGLDCVFGRLEKFLPDTRLNLIDVFGNDPDAICGPLSVYRNTEAVNSLFYRFADWRTVFESDHFYGFDETEFNEVVRDAAKKREISFHSDFNQSHDKQRHHLPMPKLHILPNGALIDDPLQKEVMMFHFNRKDIDRTWPVSC